MKKAYFAISYTNRKYFDKEIRLLQEVFKRNHSTLLVFVDVYDFKSHQEQEMMQTAFKEIDSADFLIAELSTKSIGVGIEIGYAFAKGKPVYYVRKMGTPYSTTASGCATAIIVYKEARELAKSIETLL